MHCKVKGITRLLGDHLGVWLHQRLNYPLVVSTSSGSLYSGQQTMEYEASVKCFTVKTSYFQNVPSSKRPKVITSPVKTSLHGQNVLSQIVPGLTTGWTTGCIMYTNIQPVVQPVVQPLSTACAAWQPRLNNWLHRVNKHSTGCETGWSLCIYYKWWIFTNFRNCRNQLLSFKKSRFPWP